MEDGGPSQTARHVAAHRLDFTRVPADYGDPAADQALAVDVAAGRQAAASRMHDYLAARTAFFDRVVTGALGRGVAQVVVGAAGYDGRAFRYAKPGVRWFEVDHPATQRDKLRRLEWLGVDASHVRFVEADFTRDPVAGRLRAAGLDPEAPSLFLLEGVAVYLDPAVLEDVLGQFRQVAAPGSSLAISVSLSRPRGDSARARFQATVAALGEPARSTFEAAEAEALLARTGWPLAAGDDRQAAVGHDRRRAAGLLLASAGPATPARPQPRSRQPRSRQPPQGHDGDLPLSALLSQALVAFTGPGRAAPGAGDRRSVTRPTPSAAGAGLLAELAALGPYFAVEVHRPGSPLRPPWQSLGELTGSPGALAGRIGEVRERLAAAAGCPAAAVEFRVAASIAQLGLCARLLSPALGAAATGRTLPVDVGQARWVPALGGPFRLSLPEAAVPEAAVAAEAGTAATAALLAGPITQIVCAVEAMAVSPRVLWGNVASAVNGAAAMIAAARPDLAGPAAETAAAMLASPALTGTFQGRPLRGFRRRNCCLIYRLSPERPAYCGDCVLGQ